MTWSYCYWNSIKFSFILVWKLCVWMFLDIIYVIRCSQVTQEYLFSSITMARLSFNKRGTSSKQDSVTWAATTGSATISCTLWRQAVGIDWELTCRPEPTISGTGPSTVRSLWTRRLITTNWPSGDTAAQRVMPWWAARIHSSHMWTWTVRCSPLRTQITIVPLVVTAPSFQLVVTLVVVVSGRIIASMHWSTRPTTALVLMVYLASRGIVFQLLTKICATVDSRWSNHMAQGRRVKLYPLSKPQWWLAGHRLYTGIGYSVLLSLANMDIFVWESSTLWSVFLCGDKWKMHWKWNALFVYSRVIWNGMINYICSILERTA